MNLHPLGNTLLRTPETFAQYQDNPKPTDECFMCLAPRTTLTKKWSIVENEFPYDAVATKHLLLVPNRHFGPAADMTYDERVSLEVAKTMLESQKEIDAVIENLARGRTFESHYHLHLIQWKRV